MRFVPIERAVPGMQLSKAIFDSEHRVLLGAYMELTEEFIGRLEKRGLPGFYIEDELTKDIIINEAISEELRGRAVNCLINRDIDATLGAVQEIVEQLRTSDIISLDLLDLRTFDEYTYRHSVNVAVLATIVGIGMDLNQETLLDLCSAAILHDLGKLSIDPSILNKPGKLTYEEYELMKTHSKRSYELIKNKLEISAKTKNAVLYHHENVDGSGYPKGLKGEEIILLARIIHVVDVYDALTSSRPYKSAYSPLESTEYLLGGSGIMFDPQVVQTFMKYVPIYPKGISVVLSSGEEAVVVENHMEKMGRPVVRLLDGRTLDMARDEEARRLTIARVADGAYDPRLRVSDDKRKHILVVDDMVVNLKAVQGILQEYYKVSLAKTMSQAMRFLYRKRPDLIIMDIDMPDADGIEAVKRIRGQVDKTIPVILVSALGGRDMVMKSKEANVQDYVLKPFKSLYLLDRIRNILGEGSIVR